VDQRARVVVRQAGAQASSDGKFGRGKTVNLPSIPILMPPLFLSIICFSLSLSAIFALLDHPIHRVQIPHGIARPVLKSRMEDLQLEQDEAIEDVVAWG